MPGIPAAQPNYRAVHSKHSTPMLVENLEQKTCNQLMSKTSLTIVTKRAEVYDFVSRHDDSVEPWAQVGTIKDRSWTIGCPFIISAA